MTNQQKIATIGLFIATIAVICGAWLLFSQKPNSATYITDRDTGEVYNNKVNTQQTGGGLDTTSVTLFGIQKFIASVESSGIPSTSFATDVRDAITKYSEIELKNIYPTITLRPQNMSVTKTRISAELRLGQDDKFVPVDIRIFGDGRGSLTKIGGAFYYVGGLATLDQSLFTISQSDFSGPNITVDSFTYREAALNQLENLGYAIPDLNIKFLNYENPFK